MVVIFVAFFSFSLSVFIHFLNLRPFRCSLFFSFIYSLFQVFELFCYLYSDLVSVVYELGNRVFCALHTFFEIVFSIANCAIAIVAVAVVVAPTREIHIIWP